MPKIAFACPECGVSMRVSPEHDGREINCLKCGKKILVRLQQAEAALPIEEFTFADPAPQKSDEVGPNTRQRLEDAGFPACAKAKFWCDLTNEVLFYGSLVGGFLILSVIAISIPSPDPRAPGVIYTAFGLLPYAVLGVLMARLFGAAAEFIVAACEWFSRQGIRGRPPSDH